MMSAPGSIVTGAMVVNHPTVRDRSVRSGRSLDDTIDSSRPCPSSWIPIGAESTIELACCHPRIARARAPSRTSLTFPPNSVGMRTRMASVSSGCTLAVTVKEVAILSRAGSSSARNSVGTAGDRRSQYSSSAIRRWD